MTVGRPTKSEPRNKQLNLSLTSSEFERVRLRAEAVNMRPVHFSRALVLDEGRRVSPKPGTESNAAKLIYLQLVRLGNNLNQLVRHSHRHGGPVPRELEPLLHEIRHLITKHLPR
jgi:hypothetical protein